MKPISTLFFAVAAFVLLLSCECKTCLQQTGFRISVPDSIFEKADDFVISKVGKSFFSENFFRDFIHSKKTEDGYYIRYNYNRLDYEFVDEPAFFQTDSAGAVYLDREIAGIPNCLDSPEQCDYNVNKLEAIEIAEADKLPTGVRDWDVSFRWEGSLDKYIWHVITTISETGSGDNYKAEGEEMMIDPVDGTVLKRRKWTIE